MADSPAAGGRSGRLDRDLGWMLGVVFRAYVKASEHALHDLPGGPRGYQVLTAAVGEPPRNQGAIAEELGIDRTVLTYLIDDLERLELVARRPDPADRRSRLVVATGQGRAAWQQRQDALRHVEAHILSPLSPADTTTFLTLLQQLACQAHALHPLSNLCEAALHVKPTDDAPAAQLSAPAATDRNR
ncbi:MAG TPA: MarR family transcriptional regulator [Streptosporangiaceae bacterium]|jgi:DNA-binding MarR family transcriptional regulator|nr:MarR family transcriptional regulator [Streptosporangiaceae bacterium]